MTALVPRHIALDRRAIEGGWSARFSAKVAVDDSSPATCWRWTAGTDATGYGKHVVWLDGHYANGERRRSARYAHRVALLQLGVDLPAGYHVDHLCGVPGCVRPSHLRPVPGHVNDSRVGGWANRDGLCRKGLHPWTEATIYTRPSGQQACRECLRAGERKRRARKRAGLPGVEPPSRRVPRTATELDRRALAVWPDRFLGMVGPRGTGCWTWSGRAINAYGIYRIDGRQPRAHRWGLQALGVELTGLVVDHLCREPLCVRPSHLEPVSISENTARGLSGNRDGRCRSGRHPWDAADPTLVYTQPNGKRQCRECRRESVRRRAQGG